MMSSLPFPRPSNGSEGFPLAVKPGRPGARVETPRRASTIPVSDCGTCDDCGRLTIGGRCRSCESELRRESVREQVRYRPSRVVPAYYAETDAGEGYDEAVLRVPLSASRPARRVAEVMMVRAAVRLARGDSLDFSLYRVAGGRDSIAAELERRYGTTFDRKTIAIALEELVALGVLHRVGQLADWWDPAGEPQRKVGAYVYALNVHCRRLGERLEVALHRARNHLSDLAGRTPYISASVRGEGLPPRVRGALQAVLERAQIGERNASGHWLACRCTDAGLSEGEAMKVMKLYVAGVAQHHGHRYSAREAERTVRSRYRRRGRSR